MFVNATIFYFIDSPSLEKWLNMPEFVSVAESISGAYIETDPLFSRQIDLDYDSTSKGITLVSFYRIYGNWIAFCVDKRRRPFTEKVEIGLESILIRLCFVLSILSRRVLVLNRACALNTTMFLQRFHSLLGGDFRITSPQDEWVLADISILDTVVSRAIKTSLRLHQAHIANEGIDDSDSELFDALCRYETELIICREDSPEWREAITRKPAIPQLLSLRKKHDSQAGDQFFVVILTLHNQHFTLTRLNRESVRGIWAGQQQEIVYLGNTNSERGSIQQLTSVLRNIINQACDPPIGYPVFISDMATSYSSFWYDVVRDTKLPRLFKKILGWTMEGYSYDENYETRQIANIENGNIEMEMESTPSNSSTSVLAITKLPTSAI